jgi:hypothetical protein
LIVLVNDPVTLLPVTVSVAVTPVLLEVGVTTTEAVVALVGVAPEIAHE